ncbi:hypothetical protein [Arsenicibacter rosenii]|uniref:Neuropeptide-like protein 29 n=1 Tax=Arsenicibacter rosenii TaxID=1750698 RepID=A0A1S2VIA2_9BACT|nr:hypothetical protein [Arsenicibacter rosenii]OIN57975.1 hypothetical protein BLX24_17970 [Arsenicibacter rosenii]
MKTLKASALLVGLVLTLILSSCGPSYVGVRTGYGPNYGPAYGYGPGYYRPRRVIVTPPPRVVYRSYPRYYRSAPPAYGRHYDGGRSRGPRSYRR